MYFARTLSEKNSPRYAYELADTPHIKKPTKNLDAINIHTLMENDDKKEKIKAIAAEKSITFFLPFLSAKYPQRYDDNMTPEKIIGKISYKITKLSYKNHLQKPRKPAILSQLVSI